MRNRFPKRNKRDSKTIAILATLQNHLNHQVIATDGAEMNTLTMHAYIAKIFCRANINNTLVIYTVLSTSKWIKE